MFILLYKDTSNFNESVDKILLVIQMKVAGQCFYLLLFVSG